MQHYVANVAIGSIIYGCCPCDKQQKTYIGQQLNNKYTTQRVRATNKRNFSVTSIKIGIIVKKEVELLSAEISKYISSNSSFVTCPVIVPKWYKAL
jgi:hypothetical protein